MNLADFLTATAERIPDYPAGRFENSTVTYREMLYRINGLAHGLARLGIKAGNFCVLMMPSSLNWILGYYALAKLGAVVVPVNFLYRQCELQYIFSDSGARAFIGHKDFLEEVLPAMEACPQIDLRIAEGRNLPQGFVSLEDLFDKNIDFETSPTADDDPLAVIYTSGTTGRPKGRVLTPKSLTPEPRGVGGVRHTEPEDIALGGLPLFHV